MPSRGVYRGVHSVLFDDPDYRRLPPNARLILLTLRLCRDAGPAAIFEYSLDTLERQTGLPRRGIEACLHTLEAEGWIERDDSLVWIRNGLRYDPILRPSNPLHMTAVTNWLLGLPKRYLIVKFCEYYKIRYPYGGPMPYPPPNKEKEKDKEKEKETTLSGSPEREPDIPSLRQQAREILGFLNHQAQKSFRDSDANLMLIEARLKSGMTPANLRGIIARKVRAWRTDPKMAAYLRPATLFNATKAEQYLGEREPES